MKPFRVPAGADKRQIENRLTSLLGHNAIYSRDWIDRASEMIAEVSVMRKSLQRMHRRAQKAERELLREGRRADTQAHRVTNLLLRDLTAGTHREQSAP